MPTQQAKIGHAGIILADTLVRHAEQDRTRETGGAILWSPRI